MLEQMKYALAVHQIGSDERGLLALNCVFMVFRKYLEKKHGSKLMGNGMK
jgi:hypothetical protein